jgi:hypothetical protein
MKTIITTILVILGYFGYSQTPNQIVAQYAKSHEGQKVGNGVCMNLIDSALSQIDTNWLQGSIWSEINNNGVNYGEEIFFIKRGSGTDEMLGVKAEVNIEKLKEGDIILFDDVKEGGSDKSSHIGILIFGEDGTVMIAHQNLMDGDTLIQHVVIEDISGYFYEKDGDVTQKIRVFRPQAKYNKGLSKLLSKKYSLEMENGEIFLVW